MTEQAEGDPAITVYSAQVAKNESQLPGVWGSTLERAAQQACSVRAQRVPLRSPSRPEQKGGPPLRGKAAGQHHLRGATATHAAHAVAVK